MWSSPLDKHDNDIGSLRRVEIFLDVVSNRAGSDTCRIQIEQNQRMLDASGEIDLIQHFQLSH